MQTLFIQKNHFRRYPLQVACMGLNKREKRSIWILDISQRSSSRKIIEDFK
jgi:hypothetical protein